MKKSILTMLVGAGLISNVFAHTESQSNVLTLDQFMAAAKWDVTAPVKTQKLAEGLYVLFGSGGNILVSSGDDGVIIVDDQFPGSWDSLRSAMSEQGDDEINFVINTHWHFDHAAGNKTLGENPSTWIVSQSNSRKMMLSDQLVDLVAFAVTQEAYPQSALPDITFDERMQFHLNGQQIDLVHVGPAHTTGDTAVIFRGHNAVHMGDVFNNTGYPFIDATNGGSLDGLIAFCEAVLTEIDEETMVVPGHGPIASYQDMQVYVSILKSVRAKLVQRIRAGESLEQILEAGITAQWDKKMGDPTRLLNRSYKSLTSQYLSD